MQDLSVRNLAMSTAMPCSTVAAAIKRNRPARTVTVRCIELLRLLEPALVKERLEQLLAAAIDNTGEDVAFLEKWGYDADQKKAIGDSVYAVADA